MAIAISLSAGTLFAEGIVHKFAVQVNENDLAVMNIALNNVQNLTNYYHSSGDTVEVEMVTYGPSLNMLIDGISPVPDNIATMSLEMDNLSFAAFGITHLRLTRVVTSQMMCIPNVRVCSRIRAETSPASNAQYENRSRPLSGYDVPKTVGSKCRALGV